MNKHPDTLKSLSAIEQLRNIKKVLEVAHSKQDINTKEDNIPLLIDIISSPTILEDDINIPILADSIEHPNNHLHQLANNSWQDYNSRLKEWSEQLPEPMKSLSTQFLSTLEPKLKANWLALIEELDDETMNLWQKNLNKMRSKN